MKEKQFSLLLLALLFGLYQAQAQVPAGTQSFSLEQAIRFALLHQPSVKQAQIQQDLARARVGEIRSIGLPQINAGAEVGNNVVLQRTLIDPNTFGPQIEIKPKPATVSAEQINNGTDVVITPAFDTAFVSRPPASLAFGLKYAGSAAISASQLLFDGSYLIGLKAAQVYTDLATRQAQQTEIEVIDQVTKAYYSVLVSWERMALLERNLVRLQTQLQEVAEIHKQGFAEKIDVDRLQVAFNNLQVEKEKARRLVTLGIDLLKFQMGMDLSQPIELTDKLANIVVEAQAALETNNFNYSNRIEYAVLETRQDLAKLDIRNKKAGYFPRLLLNGRYGYSGSSNNFSDLMRTKTKFDGRDYANWFEFGYVGVSLQVPIFDGLRKKYEIQQAKLNLAAVNNGFRILQQQIDLQVRQSNTNLQNAFLVLESQKQSMALAEEVTRVANIKFREGVGSNLEVVSAETELRQAQTNYYSALYDALIAKVDLQKAAGTLSK